VTVYEPRPVPALAPPRPPQPLSVVAGLLDSGLKVLAVRRGGAPLVNLRLLVPFAGHGEAHLAQADLLADSMLSGTDRRSNAELAAALQALGAELHVRRGPDWLVVAGETLAGGLAGLLELLAEVLTMASYPPTEVLGEQQRGLENLRIARSQPSRQAKEALLARMFGSHPYGRDLPDPDQLAAVTVEQVRSLHYERVLPAGSVLVVVGDVPLDSALDLATKALAGWDAKGPISLAPPVPPVSPGPIVLVDRPGSVQSSIRIGGPALVRSHPGYAALQITNIVFGGYFSSRLIQNIRERRGYTYSPISVIDHARAGAAVRLQADVATEVTAPALLEIGYELGRIATLPVEADELESARQYIIGSLALARATQSGLADVVVQLITSGLGVEWLHEQPRRLAAVTVEDVLEQASRFFAPSRLVTVVLGDADRVEPSLRSLGEVQRRRLLGSPENVCEN
jgi:predicted Zn-dependent peptidase